MGAAAPRLTADSQLVQCSALGPGACLHDSVRLVHVLASIDGREMARPGVHQSPEAERTRQSEEIGDQQTRSASVKGGGLWG